jgi:hypothetical protein
MAEANPLWGAPRIHGELLKLGIEVSERTVSRLMPKRRKPPSQSWRAFLANHVNKLISIDFFTVPTATFRVLFVLVVLAHHRRRALQRDGASDGLVDGAADNRNLSGRYSTPLPAARSGQNLWPGVSASNAKPAYRGGPFSACQPLAAGYVERLIGSIRRDCLDCVIILGERHLRAILKNYLDYYHRSRTPLALGKDAAEPRMVQPPELGDVV